MINRNLIRIRVVQMVYSWYQNTNKDLTKAEKELLFSLQKSYDLYHYFLYLPIQLTDLYEDRVESKKNKFLPTEEDLNPNTNLLDNKFIIQLKSNKQLQKFLQDNPWNKDNSEGFVKKLLDVILESETYQKYAAIAAPSYEDDKEFWRKIFRLYISGNLDLDELLEDESIYWNDDIEIVQTFVIKTIKKFKQENGENQPLLPMFKNDEDKAFALTLFTETIMNEDKYRDLIKKHTDKWDFERIAFMDLVIMQVAISEIDSFVSIPTNVTLNEYIEMAKFYSTSKSGTFVNGILDSIVNELKQMN
ncbi:MAG: transcription antitermination factor NusB [Dysgonamonadaceae bacterium]|nr:transcription antitermination factor NusB [Dysgonamonadaceae bacterium]MDD3308695.1 transcription antitermination factor NusB [Dysgonamonadaceae bacterium]MDD3901080.1 transcription antitermination factor NusB [Dysgonamonadaceae bacterium]MDD4399623.1 transcription antitermination factor NusB [Dysgonamonadaceae bacterium]MEA5080255.1 transcription antitermination factor NusB [Dysgonamonadaceae bacterium]